MLTGPLAASSNRLKPVLNKETCTGGRGRERERKRERERARVRVGDAATDTFPVSMHCISSEMHNYDDLHSFSTGKTAHMGCPLCLA